MIWEDVLAKWDDAALHDAYVADVQKRGAFGEAAQRYKEVLRERPEDAIAAKRLEQVRKLAVAVLMSRPPAEPKARSPWRVIALLLSFVFVMVLAVYLLVVDAKQERAKPRRPPTPGHALP